MLRLSSQLKQGERIEEAIKWNQKAVERAPSRKELRVAYVHLLIDQGKIQDALDQYETLATQNPQDLDLLQNWGNLIFQHPDLSSEKQADEAQRIWMKIVAAKPKDATTITRVADLLRGAERVEPALELYRKAIELAPNDPQYREYLGEYLHQQKRHEEALATWAEIANGDRRNAANLMRLSEIYQTFGKPELALATIDEAASLAPKDFALQIQGAEYAFQSAAYEQVERYLQRAAKLAETDDERTLVLDKEIGLLRENGQLASTVQRLSEELAQSTATDVSAWIRLARFYEELNRWPDALAAVKSAQKLQPDSPFVLSLSARIAENSGALKQASDMYRSLANADRRHRGVYLVKVAQLQLQLGLRDEALRTATEFIESSSGSSESYLFYAQVCQNVGNPSEQLATLRKALRSHPNDAEIRTQLARLLEDQFQLDDAIALHWQSFEKATTLDDQLVAVRSLATIYNRIDKLSELTERLKQHFSDSNQQRPLAFCLVEAFIAGEELEAAKQSLLKLLGDSAVTSDVELLEALVRVSQLALDVDSALNYQQQLVAITNSQAAKERLASLYGWSGDQEREEELLFNLAKQVTNPVQALQQIDRLMQSKRYELPEKLLEDWHQRKPEDWEILYRLAYLRMQTGKDEGAKEAITKLLNLKIPLATLAVKGRDAVLADLGFGNAALSNDQKKEWSEIELTPIRLLARSIMPNLLPAYRNPSYGYPTTSISMPGAYGVARSGAYLMLELIEQRTH